MSKRQRLEHRSALAEANRIIAFANAQLTALQSVVAELDRVGLDADEARDILDVAATHLVLLREQLSLVLRLLQMGKRQKGERRAVGARDRAHHGRGRPKSRGAQSSS